MTFHGHAGFMIENACSRRRRVWLLAQRSKKRESGLESFENSPELNLGRLNIVKVDGVTVVVDFAHNEAGLNGLIDFADSVPNKGRTITVIGTAGDRNENAIRALGQIAAERTDHVIVKGTQKYLRGRDYDELIRLYIEGIESTGVTDYEVTADELEATTLALHQAEPGDIIIIMAQEYIRRDPRDAARTRIGSFRSLITNLRIWRRHLRDLKAFPSFLRVCRPSAPPDRPVPIA